MALSNRLRAGLSSGYARIATLQILTKGVGFLREVIIARLYGVSQYVDAFVVVQSVFNLFSPLIGDAAQTAGTPFLSRIYSQSKINHLHLTSILISWSVIISVCFIFVCGLFLEPLINRITPGLLISTKYIVFEYFWILAPYAIIFAASGAFTASINSQEKFGISELGNLVINVVTFISLIIIYRYSSRVALPLSLSLGFICGFIYYYRVIRPYLTFDLLNKTVISVSKVLPAIIIGYALVQVNILVDRYFASNLPSGTFASVNYANKIMFLPLSVVGTSINSIAFVKFSSSQESSTSNTILNKTMIMVFICLLPFSIAFGVFPQAIVKLVFGGGAFNSEAVSSTSAVLRILAFALPAIGLASTLQKKLYADRDSIAVLRGTAVAVVLGITTNIVAVPKYGLTGLMTAICVSNWGLVLYLYYQCHPRHRKLKE